MVLVGSTVQGVPPWSPPGRSRLGVDAPGPPLTEGTRLEAGPGLGRRAPANVQSRPVVATVLTRPVAEEETVVPIHDGWTGRHGTSARGSGRVVGRGGGE